MYTMCLKILLNSHVSIGPLAGWCILAEDEEADGYGSDQDERDNECHSPGYMWTQMSVVVQGIIDSRHHKVSNATACISPSSRQSIRCADHVLVEETRGPDLARNKRATKDTDEEAKHIQPGRARNRSSQGSWYCTKQQTCCKGDSGSKAVACGSSYETDNKARMC